MEEEGKTAWRWRLLVLDYGMTLIAVVLPAGAMRWATQRATTDLLQNQKGELTHHDTALFKTSLCLDMSVATA